MQIIRTLALLAAVGGLAGCGDNLGEQLAIGGAAGGAAAVATEGDLVTGAAIGAAANVAYCRQYPSRC